MGNRFVLRFMVGIILFHLSPVSLHGMNGANATPQKSIEKPLDARRESTDISGSEGIYSIHWEDIRHGEVIKVAGGKLFRMPLHIRKAHGTKEKPIIIMAGRGEKPIFPASIVIEESSHVLIEGLIVRGSVYPGIAIKKGSHNITIRNCVVSENGLGIWITDKAGDENKIIGNEISGNGTHGIAIDKVNCRPGHETLISGNRVFNNGHHGVEIHGNRYIVEGNEVFGNGEKIPGTSGIHTFAENEKDDAGSHNIMKYNIVHNNKQERGPDGNGIQLDQWCDNNEVSYNIIYSNDGAGINIYDSSNDRIFNNTLYNNMLDPDGRHPYKGEIVIASDLNRKKSMTDHVVVMNNIAVSTNKSAVSILVDKYTTVNQMDIRNNIFYHKNGGDVFSWGDSRGNDPAKWKMITRQKVPDIFKDPLFKKEDPRKKEDFMLNKRSVGIGRSIRAGQTRDAMGRKISRQGFPNLGALENGP